MNSGNSNNWSLYVLARQDIIGPRNVGRPRGNHRNPSEREASTTRGTQTRCFPLEFFKHLAYDILPLSSLLTWISLGFLRSRSIRIPSSRTLRNFRVVTSLRHSQRYSKQNGTATFLLSGMCHKVKQKSRS